MAYDNNEIETKILIHTNSQSHFQPTIDFRMCFNLKMIISGKTSCKFVIIFCCFCFFALNKHADQKKSVVKKKKKKICEIFLIAT